MMRKLLYVLALALAFAPALQAQSWPSRPLRMVINFPPGGAVDQLGRALAPKLQEALGQPVVVENRGGANGNIGVAEVARAPADGYTLLLSAGSSITANPHLYQKLAADPMKDLEPVAPVALVSVFLETKPQLPVSTLAEFVAHARANPGKLNYGTPGSGSSPHLAAEMFNRAARISTVHVPYKGAAPAMTDLLAGQIDFMFDPGVGLAHVRAGKLKLLAVASPRRHPAWPEVPTVAEVLGVPFDADTVFGVYVPAGTPREIVVRLNREINAALQTADMKSRIAALGAQELVLGQEAFAARLRAEYERMGALVREAGLRVE